MKKIFSSILASTMLLAVLASCGGQTGTSSTTETSTAPAQSTVESPATSATVTPTGEVKKIGVVQFAPHDALTLSYTGFVDALAEAGYADGDNIKIDFQNAAGAVADCTTIVNKFVSDKDDLIFAIATPAAQSAISATTDIPILFTAVTDPVEAGLVASIESPGMNVSGTSDLTPCAAQIDLIPQLIPSATRVGILYNSSEVNSVVQADLARAQAESLGLEVQDYTVTNTNEIAQVVQSMSGKVDVIYAPTDNLIADAMPTVSQFATEQNIPIIAGENGMVEKGALATYGIDYYELGKLTGQQAVQILEGTDVGTIPVEYSETFHFSYNPEVAQELGITIPQELIDSSASVA